MNAYQPSTRRPIADVLRKTAHLSVQLAVRWDIRPNTVSMCSIVASLLAAVCFCKSGHWPWLLVPAAGFCYMRLWLNMLDGMVALASGKASRLGEVFNELPDRVSDVMIFVGVAHSGLCEPAFGYWVAILALCVAYVGTFAQAVGVGRLFNGTMAKPWRMVILHVGAWLALAVALTHVGLGARNAALSEAIREPVVSGRWGSLTILDLTLLVIMIGCIQTIWVRLSRMVKALQQSG